MKRNWKKLIPKIKFLSLIGIILVGQLAFFLTPEFSDDYKNSEEIDQYNNSDNGPLLSSEEDFQDIIVSFNQSSYSSEIITNFTKYGGENVKQFNNDTFNSISMFFGSIPKENKTTFKETWPNATIEDDEIVETYMNYATVQTAANNTAWNHTKYNGSTNGSIAVIDSGINANHSFFPNGYNGTRLEGDIVDQKNFVDESGEVTDDDGHGTFISSVISGSGDIEGKNSTDLFFSKNYSHTDTFGSDPAPGNFSSKIMTFNISSPNSQIKINTSRNDLNEGLDKFWVELYHNSTLVDNSENLVNETHYNINHTVSEEQLGLYDLYIKYHKKVDIEPLFTFNASMNFYPESYSRERNFSGLANETKLASYKVINQSGLGSVSDVIKALNRTISNKNEKHIISVCLSIGTLGEDVDALSTVIDEVINNGTLVIIAAGNNGVTPESLNRLATNENAIVVGATNDKDQVTSYSNMGEELESGVIKPDILAAGGSSVSQHRSIIAAGGQTNKTTAAYGTSISAALVSAATNILVQAKWNNWSEWKNQNLTKVVKTIKSILLMTGSETNLLREDDPNTSYDESDYSPSLSDAPLTEGITDIHEGYGRMNLQTAIDALTKYTEVNKSISGHLESSNVNPLGTHAFARRIHLESNKTYVFNLTGVSDDADFDMFLFSNESNQYGEPILLESIRKWYDPTSNSFYFSPNKDQTESIVVIKARDGASPFNLSITNITNAYEPEFEVPEISYANGTEDKNTTVLSTREDEGEIIEGNYTIDSFQFFIEYSDNDTFNSQPQEIELVIEDKNNYSLNIDQLRNEGEINFSEGVIYSSEEIKFSVPGTFKYYFVGSDGAHDIRYPESGSLSIEITQPETEQFPHEIRGSSIGNEWADTGTGWNRLLQSNTNDDRERIHPGGWNTMYFGTAYSYTDEYTYQPAIFGDPYPNGTLTSPLYNLTNLNEDTNPIAKFGIRVSINDGDEMNLYLSHNWSTWEEIASFENQEEEWSLFKVNLSEYKGSYVQFRFEADLDDTFDQTKYRGFMFDYFAIQNYTNNSPGEIRAKKDLAVTPNEGFRYRRFKFACEYYDEDNNYPEDVKLEINGNTYDMLNIYGDWDASSEDVDDWGILFQKSLIVGDMANRTFRFIVNDGNKTIKSEWYNEDDSLIQLSDPNPLEYNTYTDTGLGIGYEYNVTSLDDFYVGGKPVPNERTAWLGGDNTWHPINSLTYGNVMYGGVGQYNIQFGENNGYGKNWNAKLITKPIYIGKIHTPYLKFTHDFSLDYEDFEFFTGEHDKLIVSVSTDFGESWEPIREYYREDSPDDEASVKIDISKYREKNVMMMFTLDSNDWDPYEMINSTNTGTGWFLKDIYVGFEKSADFVAPTIEILSPTHKETVNSDVEIKAELSDNTAIDEERVQIYINDESAKKDQFEFDEETGILTYTWDTWQHDDGIYDITIVAFDKEGNRVEETITVEIENGYIDFYKWGPWIIGILIAIILATAMYLIAERRGKAWINRIQNYNAEKKRLERIDRNQAIKRIEILEPEEEMARPLSLHCKLCKRWFISDKFDMICPECGHDQIYAAYNCVNCGNWYFKEEPSREYYCPNKECKGIRLIRRTSKDIKEILAEEGKFPLKFKKKKKDDEFSILD
ncbi:MAG: S8 family serine peptidase [Promethearchaeia archaeon]